MTPEAKRELRMMSLELAGLHNKASDLVTACSEHRGGMAHRECATCLPFIEVCERISVLQQRYQFTRNGAEYAANAAALDEPSASEAAELLEADEWRLNAYYFLLGFAAFGVLVALLFAVGLGLWLVLR